MRPSQHGLLGRLLRLLLLSFTTAIIIYGISLFPRVGATNAFTNLCLSREKLTQEAQYTMDVLRL